MVIVAGLVTIGVVIGRKLPQVAALDVESLPEEHVARKKKELLIKRVEAEGRHAKEVWKARLVPLKKWWGKLQLKFRIYVGRVERLWHHEQSSKIKTKLTTAEIQAKVQAILGEGAKRLAESKWEEAETLFISAITLDKKNTEAYRGLADAYLGAGSIPEATETYKFLFHLNPSDDMVAVKLGEIAEKNGSTEEAIEYYQQAVVLNDSLSPRFYHLAELLLKVNQPLVAREAILSAVTLEPKNPKYLDLLIEVAILVSDKSLATSSYNELRLVNPDNQKLADFKTRISAL